MRRNKKLLSTVVASALVATTMAAPAMAADGDTIDVGVTTKTAVLKVSVPTSMAIAVDQFEMADVGTQIHSGEFEMENNSGIDVKVDIESTADLKATTKLAATKAAVTADTAGAGEAWLAVAAQTGSGSYADGAATALKDLSEANANVTTFTAGSAANTGVAGQTFYLAKASTPKYTLLNANQKADFSYAQFYELTAETAGAQAALNVLIAAGDVYVATGAAADDQELTLVPKGGAHTWATGEVYYSVAASATPKASIADTHTELYVYANGDADAAAGKAAFRYIGNLSGGQETWSSTDITNVHIKYDIVGITQTGYDKVKTNCTYGLYKAPIVDAAPSITDANKTYTAVADTDVTVNVSLGSGTLKADNISSLSFVNPTGATKQVSNTEYSYADGVLTLKGSAVNGFVNSTQATRDYTITFDDTANTTAKFTLSK